MREREEESMIPTSTHKEKHHQHKEESFRWLSNTVTLFFYLTCIAITIIISLELILNDKNVKFSSDIRNFKQKNASTIKGTESCDIFRGRWLPDPNALLYTNFSCKQLAWTKNCLLHGRKDRDYLDWKWKPDDCELPRFSAATFLSILRGKKMAFIGDSLARNQMESLLCLLSTVETPESEGNSDDQNKTWKFREHNFTLAVFWSQFLVASTAIAGVDGFNIHLNTVDNWWSDQLPSIDYTVLSASHWFFKRNYFYHNGQVIGCMACNQPGIINLEPGRAIRMAFRTALRAINDCQSCKKKIVSFVRTYTPGHFENGSWDDGGTCNHTRPVEREEVNMALPYWGYSKMQKEEVTMARREGMGKGKGNEFDFLDITEMMAMRVDGHPGPNWPWRSKSNDCLHWCLPGPIDAWNALLLDRIKTLDSM